jgi:hypothetical protein
MNSPPADRGAALRAAGFWLLLATLGGLAYARAIPLGPFSDDNWMLLFGRYGPFDLSWFRLEAVSWSPFYRPFALTVWKTLGRVLDGFVPGYRLFIVVLHATNAACLAGLMRRGAATAGDLPRAAALLFVLVPAPEVVIWLSGLYDVTATFLYLATLLCAATFWQTGRARWYLVSLVTFQLCVWSKESAFTLPAALFLLAWWVPFRPAWARVLAHAAPYGLIVAANLAQRYVAWNSLGGYAGAVPSAQSLAARLAVGLAYAIMPVPGALFRWRYLLPAAALAAVILVIGWFSRRHRRTIAFGLLWSVLTLLPSALYLDPRLLGILGVNSRYLYLPAVGACIAMAAALHGACERWLGARRWAWFSALAVLCATYVGILQVHVRTWQVAGRAVDAIPASIHRVLPDLAPFTCLQVPDLPKFYKGAYIYWIGLDAALLARYGSVVESYCGGVGTPLPMDDPPPVDALFQVGLVSSPRGDSWDVEWARGVTPRGEQPPLAGYFAARTPVSFGGRMGLSDIIERAIARPVAVPAPVVAEWRMAGCSAPDHWSMPAAVTCDSQGGLRVPASASAISLESPPVALSLPGWAEVIVSVRTLADRDGAGQLSVRWRDRRGAWRADGVRAMELPAKARSVDLHLFVAASAHRGVIAQIATDIVSPGTAVEIDRIVVRALP